MTAARPLFDPGPATGNLTAKQQIILAHLQAHPGGLRAIDIGRHLHLERGCPVCLPDRTCQYASRDANVVLEQLGTSGRRLVIRRRTGLWQLVHPPVTGYDPPTAPIPF